MPLDALKITRSEGDLPDKRQEILDVAAVFFLSYGYEGSSVNAMARHSGISKESFYRYFDSKVELFKAVVERELVQYRDELLQMTEHWGEEGIRESLVMFAQTLLGVVMTERQQALRRLVFNEIHRMPEIGRHYWEIGPELAYRSLEDFFKLHASKTSSSPHWLSRSFIALLLHEPMLAHNCGVRENPDADQIRELAESVVDHFLAAYFDLQ